MKKQLWLVAIITIIICTLAGGSIAYYTTEWVAKNEVHAGNVVTELLMLEETEAGIVASTSTVEVAPGRSVSRIAQIKNTGDNDAWVRIRVNTEISLNEAQSGQKADTSLVTLKGPDVQNWTFKDGYWYYNEALKPGKATDPLFTGVEFSTAMNDIYQNSTVNIIVEHQGTQKVNNGNTVFEAAGWPEE